MSPSDEESAEVECVGCRQTGCRRDLERFVYHDSVGLVFDMRGGAPGRSAFVHPLPGCIRAAAWAGFSRAFETPLRELDGEAIVDEVRTGLQVRMRERIREARRLDDLAVGRGATSRMADGGDLEVVLIDREAGREARTLAERLGEPSGRARFELASGMLSEALGTNVVIAGVRGGKSAESIGRTAEKWICIETNGDEG